MNESQQNKLRAKRNRKVPETSRKIWIFGNMWKSRTYFNIILRRARELPRNF
jgi:hypothetical protein